MLWGKIAICLHVFLSVAAQIGCLISPKGNNLHKQQPGGGDEGVSQLISLCFSSRITSDMNMRLFIRWKSLFLNSSPGWRSFSASFVVCASHHQPRSYPSISISKLPPFIPPLSWPSAPPRPTGWWAGRRGIAQRTQKIKKINQFCSCHKSWTD